VTPVPFGDMTRRELLDTLARWTVPSVVTISLGARGLAAASCPPCQKKQGATCRACSMSQILNCQCEPCLGPPYCSAVGPVAPVQPRMGSGGALTQPYQPAQPPSALPPSALKPTAPGFSRPQSPARDPFGMIGPRDPFRTAPPSTLPRDPASQGLYQRLRPDSLPRRNP
jgi:hypothetical protein